MKANQRGIGAAYTLDVRPIERIPDKTKKIIFQPDFPQTISQIFCGTSSPNPVFPAQRIGRRHPLAATGWRFDPCTSGRLIRSRRRQPRWRWLPPTDCVTAAFNDPTPS